MSQFAQSTSKKPHDLPPPANLDDLWRDLSQQMGSIFGDNKPTPNPHGKNSIKQVLLGGAYLCLGLWLSSGVVLVFSNEAAVVHHFGKYQKTIQSNNGMGLDWHLPSPFASHEVLDLSVKKINIDSSNAKSKLAKMGVATKNAEMVNFDFVLNYRINPLQIAQFAAFQNQPQVNVNTDVILARLAEAVTKEVLSGWQADVLFAADVQQQNKQRIELQLQIQLQLQRKIELSGMGLEVISIAFPASNNNGIEPVAAVKPAFLDWQAAQNERTDVLKKTQINEDELNKQSEYQNQLLQLTAQNQARKITEKAKQDAKHFDFLYALYQQAPKVMQSKLYWDTMEPIYAKASKVWLGTNVNASGLVFQIPQPSGSQSQSQSDLVDSKVKNIENSNAERNAEKNDTSIEVPAAAQANTTENSSRSRDSLPNRTRELR